MIGSRNYDFAIFLSSSASSKAISISGGDSLVSTYTIALRFFPSTPRALGHRRFLLRTHSSHLGDAGTQITYSRSTTPFTLGNTVLRTCPKPTIIWLMSLKSSFGSQDCKFSLMQRGLDRGVGRSDFNLPCLLRRVRWWFMPSKKIRDPMDMDVDADPISAKLKPSS